MPSLVHRAHSTPSRRTVAAPPTTTALPGERPLRLRLKPSTGSGAVDGAWWPYSRDLVPEVLDLVNHFPSAFGRICRVIYSTPDWDRNVRRRIQADRVFVSLGSFPKDDTHLVMLRSTSPRVSRVLLLLVVPPEWDERTARHAMLVAASPSKAATGRAILEESRDLDLAGRLSHWEDDGGESKSPSGTGIGSRTNADGD
ncbi:DUF5994 family protein [Microlunatus phosphovorus]|uniref:DUF5994 family protein n=1 Tax=Microlunatus phosphovorus TaxID=29405 RepID=UPI0012EA7A76|nr:DUF5994 family protein [Microlunatus phosphovorus]